MAIGMRRSSLLGRAEADDSRGLELGFLTRGMN
jgi:hypothetical protein